MTERPILFNSWKVRAIHDGATQTRRPMKDPPECMPHPCCWYEPTIVVRGEECPGPRVYGTYNDDRGWKSPFGAPGDLLWVRETWRVWAGYDNRRPLAIPKDGGPAIGERNFSPQRVSYYADKASGLTPSGDDWGRWRPNIHMPKWACRTRLLVKRGWVERLTSISDADVRAEGIHVATYPEELGRVGHYTLAARLDFADLWDSIYAAKYPWADNPWVFGCEFEVKT